MREKNKLLSESILWSIEPKYAIKKTVKGSQVGREGGGWEFSPNFTVFLKTSLNNTTNTRAQPSQTQIISSFYKFFIAKPPVPYQNAVLRVASRRTALL